MHKQSDLVRDVIEPGWREREADRQKAFETAVAGIPSRKHHTLTEAVDRIAELEAFVLGCATAAGGMVSGNRLSIQANKLLGNGDVCGTAAPGIKQGGQQ